MQMRDNQPIILFLVANILFYLVDNLPISPVTQTHPNQTANIPKYGCSTLKDFTDAKLTHLIEPINSMMQMDKYIPLVTSNSGSIHLHDEALTVFQRYSGNDIAFVGLWGSTNSDKNRFYQSIFALADATDEVSSSFIKGSKTFQI